MEIKINSKSECQIKDLIKKEVSRKFYKYLKRCNHKLYINGNEVKNYQIIKENEILNIEYDDLAFSCKPLDLDLNVIYESNNYMIIYKPKGLPTIPKNKDDSYSLYNAIYNYYLKNNISASIHFISRLDEDTEGLILVGKDKNSSRILNSLKNEFDKYYYAICDGYLDQKEGIIDRPILKTEDNRRIVSNDGKSAQTIYKVVKEKDNHTLLNIKLITGRTHQIRIHFLSLSHPLSGDKIYNPNSIDDFHLCAYKLKIFDPFDKEEKIFEIEPLFVKEF